MERVKLLDNLSGWIEESHCMPWC